jgi:6-phosphogluconolactonase (cycloisomerase 2 family)
MFKKFIMMFTLAVLIFIPAAAVAQVKIGEIVGSPGAFDVTSTLLFSADASLGFVTNPGSGTVQKFRSSTSEVLDEISLPGSAVGPAALSPDEKTLIVLGVANQQIYIIATADVKTGKMTIRKTVSYEGSGFTGRSNVVITKNGTWFLVADSANDSVVVFSLYGGLLQDRIPVGANPLYMAPDPKNRGFAVLCSGREAGDPVGIWIVNEWGLIDIPPIPVFKPQPFNNIVATPTGYWLAVPSFDNDEIVLLNANTGSLARRPSEGKGPSKLIVSGDGRFAAVVNITSKNIALFALPEFFPMQGISTADLNLTSDTMPTFSTDGRFLYLPSPATAEILAYSIPGNFTDPPLLQKRIMVGKGPNILNINSNNTILASTDLQSNVVSLLAKNPIVYYMPHLTQTGSEYSGLALANLGTQGATIALLARTNRGTIIPGTSNPRYLFIPPNQQYSLIPFQFFGFNANDTLDGYVEAYTLNAGLTILYMSGNDSQTRLDGFVADGSVDRQIGFSRITEGTVKFGTPTSTEIILLNPSDTDAALSMSLFAKNPAGEVTLMKYKEMALPAHNRIHGAVSQLMETLFSPLENMHLEVISNVDIKGLEIVKIGDSIAMMPAGLRSQPNQEFFAAQVASGGQEPSYYSNLSMVNTTEGPITATIQVSGATIPKGSKSVNVTLAGHEAYSAGINEIFGLPNPLVDPTLYSGTLRITTDKPGLIADLIYGDALHSQFLTAESLHAERGTKFALAHFAQGNFGDPPKGIYTGIAIYNPNAYYANVSIKAHKPSPEYPGDNLFLGDTLFRLEAGNRIVQTIGQFIPAITQQAGGTITIESDLPLLLFEVFGASNLDFLVAVPPVVLTP